MCLPNIHIPPKIIYSREDGTSDVFLIHERLGRGGFAVVHRVTHQNTHKTYAMKIISKQRYNNPKGKIFLEKIKNETAIQKSLDHPNIVRAKLSFADEFNQYIVLEYCPGKSIREYLRKSVTGRLSEPETRKILRDIVQGLIYLHNRQIIHHDLKLENFLIGSDGKVKIADFGISSIMKDDSSKNYLVCGTTGYMSPEMLHKDNKGHSYEVDIWALGVSAFLMLTGQQPFEGIDKESTQEKIKMGNYSFPMTNPPLSYEAKDFIKSILRLDPNKRPSLVDLAEHPFLSKYDKEQIQLYKPPFSSQKLTPVQNRIIPLIPKNQSIRNLSPPVFAMKNIRSSCESIQRAPMRISDDFASPIKKLNFLNNSLPCSAENNQSNVINTTAKKSFVIPNSFVAKYCFCNDDIGYLLGDGTVGVCFDDRSRIVLDPREKFVQYYKNYNSSFDTIEMDEVLNEEEKIKSKISLVQKFAKSLKMFSCLYEIGTNNYDSFTPLRHVKYFVKKNDQILFKLNDKNIQVNFNDHKKMVIFWNTKKMCLVKFLKEKCNLLDLKDVVNMNSNSDEFKKYKSVKELLSALALKI